MWSTEAPGIKISAALRDPFRDEGYMILTGAIPKDMLQTAAHSVATTT